MQLFAVLQTLAYEGETCVGIFSTLEAARAAAERIHAAVSPSYGMDVLPFTLDQALPISESPDSLFTIDGTA